MYACRDARLWHAWEMYACRDARLRHAWEMYACRDARLWHAWEMHACRDARLMHAQEMHTREMYAYELPAYEMHAYKMHLRKFANAFAYDWAPFILRTSNISFSHWLMDDLELPAPASDTASTTGSVAPPAVLSFTISFLFFLGRPRKIFPGHSSQDIFSQDISPKSCSPRSRILLGHFLGEIS